MAGRWLKITVAAASAGLRRTYGGSHVTEPGLEVVSRRADRTLLSWLWQPGQKIVVVVATSANAEGDPGPSAVRV
jgi:hypothetical protein